MRQVALMAFRLVIAPLWEVTPLVQLIVIDFPPLGRTYPGTYPGQVLQLIADRVAQNLEIISKTFFQQTRILPTGFTISTK